MTQNTKNALVTKDTKVINQDFVSRFYHFLEYSEKVSESRDINHEDYSKKWFDINSYKVPFDITAKLISTRSFATADDMVKYLSTLETESTDSCHYFSFSLQKLERDYIQTTTRIDEKYDADQCNSNIYNSACVEYNYTDG
ncbi:hypothetical protein [Rickettsiales endosymbiont of Trichoplax sp. H2]|uniref:hypothetical protein n=1 Tax=Rickettsiales endosymbiont of Trichoplax sp. H2 TaxID=2021221 RepID=UPI0012B2390B|nr:hypothetical protein [Rickettsiales endosymbiont of Trichoplax sp. H2]MSO14560.1 hypothetical protein [Rickettsiales endosymbiont of Trichoplax sp. H2]